MWRKAGNLGWARPSAPGWRARNPSADLMTRSLGHAPPVPRLPSLPASPHSITAHVWYWITNPCFPTSLSSLYYPPVAFFPLMPTENIPRFIKCPSGKQNHSVWNHSSNRNDYYILLLKFVFLGTRGRFSMIPLKIDLFESLRCPLF